MTSSQASVQAVTVERYRARSMRSRDPWFRCVSKEQLAFAGELGKELSPIITVEEAFLELRRFISLAKHLPPTHATTFQTARSRREGHLNRNEVLRNLALS
jgi:hypothetical protein